MNISILRWPHLSGIALALLTGWGVQPAQAQEGWQGQDPPRSARVDETGTRVSLADALEAARSMGPQVAAATARSEAARHQYRATSAAVWPSLGVEAGALRTEDPVAVFGARLRQARFTQADFDPTRLNEPSPLNDWNAALVLGWTPLDFSRAAGIRAAGAAAEASELASEWTVCVAEFQAEVRYLEAVGAELLRSTARSAVEAAAATRDVIGRRNAEGLLTTADVLQAESALESARARALSAEQAVADARGRLALAIGWASGEPVPVGDDWDGDVSRSCAATPRSDLSASEAGVRSAHTKIDQAGRARLPTVRGFARLDRHSAEPLTGGAQNWTLGFTVSLPVFTGFEIGARERAASAAARAAGLEHEQRIREARTDLAAARRAVDVSERAATAADAASRAATEAARLMRRRFEQGLVTTADLLSVQARAADLAAAAVNARLTHRRAVAQAGLLDDSRLHADDDVGGFDR